MNPPPEPPPAHPTQPPALPQALPPPKSSVLAVLSLVFGLLGCTVIGALAGIVCGIVALTRINRSGGQLKGSGLAIAGIIVSGVMLLLLPVLAGLTLPALAKGKAKAQTVQSVNNLKQLGLAARIYSTDNKDTFPAGPDWSETLRTYLGNADTVLRRPASPADEPGYGYNAAVAGKKETDVAPDTVLFFELEVPERDAVGGEELLRRPRGNGDLVVVGFADGSVMQLRGDRLAELRWEP